MRVKLSDVCVEGGIQTGPFGAQLHQSDYSEWGTPVCMPVNLVDGSISENGIARVSEEHVERLSRYKVKRGDLLYARRGDVGRGSLVGAHEDGWLCGTGCLKVTPDPSKIDSRYLFYLTSLPETIGWLVNHAKGTTMLNLNTAILSSLPLEIERNLEKQRRIAEVLSAYDELIENNRRQIKLLEEAAQRLYKEWFIDLNFPGHETTPIHNGLPEGWMKMTIKDICKRIQSGSTPSRKHAGFWDKGRYRWFKTAELQDCYLFDSEEHISGEALDYTSVKLYPANTVLMAIYASPTLGRLGILTEDSTFNQAALALMPNESYVSVEWLYLKLWELRDEFNQIARGTGQQNISGEIVKNYEIVVPTKEAVSTLTSLISPLFRAVRNAQQETNAAREARDRLLPRLMSGEIEV